MNDLETKLSNYCSEYDIELTPEQRELVLHIAKSGKVGAFFRHRGTGLTFALRFADKFIRDEPIPYYAANRDRL